MNWKNIRKGLLEVIIAMTFFSLGLLVAVVFEVVF